MKYKWKFLEDRSRDPERNPKWQKTLETLHSWRHKGKTSLQDRKGALLELLLTFFSKIIFNHLKLWFLYYHPVSKVAHVQWESAFLDSRSWILFPRKKCHLIHSLLVSTYSSVLIVIILYVLITHIPFYFQMCICHHFHLYFSVISYDNKVSFWSEKSLSLRKDILLKIRFFIILHLQLKEQ